MTLGNSNGVSTSTMGTALSRAGHVRPPGPWALPAVPAQEDGAAAGWTHLKLVHSSSFSASFRSTSALTWDSSSWIRSVLVSSSSRAPWGQRSRRGWGGCRVRLGRPGEQPVHIHPPGGQPRTSASSRAAWSSLFSPSSAFLAFSSSWMLFPLRLTWSARSLISSVEWMGH